MQPDDLVLQHYFVCGVLVRMEGEVGLWEGGVSI